MPVIHSVRAINRSSQICNEKEERCCSACKSESREDGRTQKNPQQKVQRGTIDVEDGWWQWVNLWP